MHQVFASLLSVGVMSLMVQAAPVICVDDEPEALVPWLLDYLLGSGF